MTTVFATFGIWLVLSLFVKNKDTTTMMLTGVVAGLLSNVWLG